MSFCPFSWRLLRGWFLVRRTRYGIEVSTYEPRFIYITSLHSLISLICGDDSRLIIISRSFRIARAYNRKRGIYGKQDDHCKSEPPEVPKRFPCRIDFLVIPHRTLESCFGIQILGHSEFLGINVVYISRDTRDVYYAIAVTSRVVRCARNP